MDVVTLGAALSIMKKMPDTAASSAAAAGASATAAQQAQQAAEAAAEQAEGAIEVDDTLSVEGRAADAKVTGDKINDLKEDIYAPIITAPISSELFEQGAISTKGIEIENINFIRTKSYIPKGIVSFSCTGRTFIKVYKNDVFVGNYNGSLPLVNDAHFGLFGNNIDLTSIYNADKDYRIRFVFTNGITESTVTVVDDADDIIIHSIGLYGIRNFEKEINQIDKEINQIDKKVLNIEQDSQYVLDDSLFEQGGVDTYGSFLDSPNFIRTKAYINSRIANLETDGGIYIKVYKDDIFVGNYNGELPISTTVHVKLTGKVFLSPVYEVDSEYKIRLVYTTATTGSSTPTSVSDAKDITCTESSVITVVKDYVDNATGKVALFGKKISIYGDSISTFAGWIPTGNAVYYTGQNAGVSNVDETWWKKVINTLRMELVVNNSWSGRAVSSIRDGMSGHATDAGYKEENVLQLKNGIVLPEIIIVKLGINDFNSGATLGNYDGSTPLPSDPTNFLDAYAIMLDLIMTNFPLAEVYCCTLMQCERTGGKGFPEINSKGNSIGQWNEGIKKLAHAFGAKILNHDVCGLTYYNMSTYMGDYSDGNGLHPNAAGHNLIANQTIRDM